MLKSDNVYGLLDKCSGKFWNCKKLLTFSRPWNFVTGSRSVGKSTNIAIFFILDFLKNDHKFIYCRRTKDETLLTCNTFFGNAVPIINKCTEYNITNFEYNGGEYYIELDGDEAPRQCGKVVPLSLEQKYKSSNFSEYCNLVYDEFICQDSTRYLGSKDTPDREYRAVISLYQTIDRGIDRPYRNETRFFFLGNTATIYNPIFLSLNISDYITDEKARFIRPKSQLWILERIESVEATSEIENSFAFMLSDEIGRDYAYRNKGADSDEYIKPVPEHARTYIHTLKFKGRSYGLYRSLDNFAYYIGTPLDIGSSTIALDNESHTETDLKLVTTWSEHPLIMSMIKAYKQNKLFFANGRIKSAFYIYFNLTP